MTQQGKTLKTSYEEKSLTQKVTWCMTIFTWNIQTQQIHTETEGGEDIARAGSTEEWGVSAHWYGVSFVGDEISGIR